MDPVLKTRLVGAAVVILLAVIFVPMLLGPAKPEKQLNSALNSPDREVYALPERAPSTIQPLGELATAPSVDDAKSKLSSLANQFPAEVDPVEPVEVLSKAVIEPVVVPSRQTTKPAIVTPKPISVPVVRTPETNAAVGDFAVQVGSFGDRNRAVVLKDKLQSSGYPAFIESSESNGSEMHRVKTGPVASRDEGQSLLKLMQQDGLVKQGIIVSQAN